MSIFTFLPNTLYIQLSTTHVMSQSIHVTTWFTVLHTPELIFAFIIYALIRTEEPCESRASRLWDADCMLFCHVVLQRSECLLSVEKARPGWLALSAQQPAAIGSVQILQHMLSACSWLMFILSIWLISCRKINDRWCLMITSHTVRVCS